MEEVRLTVLNPIMLQVEWSTIVTEKSARCDRKLENIISTIVTGESAPCDQKLENIIKLSVMWYVAPESITYLIEEEIRHVFF